MPSAQEAREARRRKILARGSDRLAFIAGELASISSPGLAPTASGSDVVPSTAPIPRSGDDALIRLIDESPAEERQGVPASSSVADVEEFASEQFGYNGSTRVVRNGEDERNRALQEIQDFAELEEKVANLSEYHYSTDKHLHLTALEQNLDREGNWFTRGGALATSFLTWNRIDYAIDATQNFRAAGAFVLALIAVLQSFLAGTHLERNLFSNWVLPWPVALVIVTDMSLVFGALLLGLARTPTLIKSVDFPELRTGEMSSQLGCYLEIGTVFIRTSRALFLDFSIYLVTLISGYTLTKSWQ